MLSSQPYAGTIVVLDDEEGMRRALSKLLGVEGFHVTTFSDGTEALTYLQTHAADILLSDMRMPGMTGREVLDKVMADNIAVEVILMTGFGTIEEAIECVKTGAFDYVTKPLNHNELGITLRRAVERKRLKDMNRALSRAYATSASAEELIGNSPAMQAVRALIGRVAPTESAVLITGESGTGKELAARAMHRHSPRHKGRFVAINCASIPESLMESELFGHERGAFTGANETKIGLIEVADGGTLFLDEIGELPLPMQAKLLRVLQEREITRVGGLSNIAVDIRVVAATNRNLEAEIAAKRFREDLYYRLNVIQVGMPPLRERREDIAVIAEVFLREIAGKSGHDSLRFSEDAVAALMREEYPGNVRELRNVVERLSVLCDEDVISAADVRRAVMPARGAPSAASKETPRTESFAQSAAALAGELPDFREARDRFEREYLAALLRRHGGSVANASKAAGMSRRNFYEKIEKLGIPVARDPSASDEA